MLIANVGDVARGSASVVNIGLDNEEFEILEGDDNVSLDGPYLEIFSRLGGLEGSDGFMRDEIVEIKSCGNKNSIEKEDESQKKKRGITRNKWDGKKKGVRKLNEALKLGQIEARPSGVFGPEMKRSGLK
ncbi:hypothetical protein PVK06_004416 [Gossypium arboreum]|uniref:Uncharacterized protein n=1 Tax=Gossypium arboreum TaxID=29729 RepID=A0ABR0QT02_GOSAR|nr:hypothetical protein PVK06_004416 [Gossypium arboreum]